MVNQAETNISLLPNNKIETHLWCATKFPTKLREGLRIRSNAVAVILIVEMTILRIGLTLSFLHTAYAIASINAPHSS